MSKICRSQSFLGVFGPYAACSPAFSVGTSSNDPLPGMKTAACTSEGSLHPDTATVLPTCEGVCGEADGQVGQVRWADGWAGGRPRKAHARVSQTCNEVGGRRVVGGRVDGWWWWVVMVVMGE